MTASSHSLVCTSNVSVLETASVREVEEGEARSIRESPPPSPILKSNCSATRKHHNRASVPQSFIARGVDFNKGIKEGRDESIEGRGRGDQVSLVGGADRKQTSKRGGGNAVVEMNNE